MEVNNKIPIRALIYHVADGRTAVKAYANVAIGDYLTINSFSIACDSVDNNTLVVYSPTVRANCKNGKKYKRIVEFPGWEESDLKSKIDKVCILAYRKYEDDRQMMQYGDPVYVGIEELVNFKKEGTQNPQKSADDNNSDWESNIPF